MLFKEQEQNCNNKEEVKKEEKEEQNCNNKEEVKKEEKEEQNFKYIEVVKKEEQNCNNVEEVKEEEKREQNCNNVEEEKEKRKEKKEVEMEVAGRIHLNRDLVPLNSRQEEINIPISDNRLVVGAGTSLVVAAAGSIGGGYARYVIERGTLTGFQQGANTVANLFGHSNIFNQPSYG
jgi:hypothetical protein